MNPTFSLIGRGRAGGSMALALEAAGWRLEQTFGRGDDISAAAAGVDVCVIATPDAAIATLRTRSRSR